MLRYNDGRLRSCLAFTLYGALAEPLARNISLTIAAPAGAWVKRPASP